MIVKIKSHKRDAFKLILEYMMNERERFFPADKSTFTITHNLKGKTVSEWVKQYKANELLRTRKRIDSVILTHEILSWHMDDAKHITISKMEDMAQEYIRQRNPRGIYVAVPHFDKEHYHIHICTSGVEYQTGKSLRLSKADLLKLKKGFQEYQKEKFPELTNSIENHGANHRSKSSDKEYQLKLRSGRETAREQIISQLLKCQKQSRSKEQFLNLLLKHNLHTYERSGRKTGIIHHGIKFRFSRLGLPETFFKDMEYSGIRRENLSDVRERNTGEKMRVKSR